MTTGLGRGAIIMAGGAGTPCGASPMTGATALGGGGTAVG